MKRLARKLDPRFNSRTRNGNGMSRNLVRSVGIVAMVCAVASAAGGLTPTVDSADGAFGDRFGFAVINDGAGPAQEAPAMPEADHAFWAGTCDRTTAPGLGDPILPTTGPGAGIGGYSPNVYSPNVVNGSPASYEPVTAPVVPAHCIEWGVPSVGGDLPWSVPPTWRLAAQTQAGGHPDGSTNFAFERPESQVDGSLDNIVVDLPAGFVGDPTAVAQCTGEQFRAKPLACPPESQVGVLHLEIQAATGGANIGSDANGNERIYPVYNVEPRRGNAAELGFGYASGEDAVTVRIVAKARTNGDFGVTAWVGQIPAALQVRSQQITVWGVPWAASNDLWRASADLRPGGTCSAQPGVSLFSGLYIPPSGLTAPGCAQHYDPSWGPIKPFISNLTECTGGGLETRIAIDEFQQPGGFVSDGRALDAISGKYGFANGDPDPGDGDWRRYSSPAPAMTGCEKNPFDPVGSFDPTSTDADSATGLDVDISVPQNDTASTPKPDAGAPQPQVDAYVQAATEFFKSDAGVATSHLDKTVVPLPEGLAVNPSSAAGLEACSDAQMGVTGIGNPYTFNNAEPACPDGSKIGIVQATTPLLEEKLTGEFILGAPRSTDPTSGEMLRVFLVVRNAERGVLAKVFGSTVADPVTGRLTATFDNNPRLPVENIKVALKGGDRGVFAQAQTCGQKTTNAVFTPWTAAHGGGGVAETVSDSFTVGGDCSFAFAPTLAAGTSSPQARGTTTFAFSFERPQGQQWINGLTAKLPAGLLASVKDFPLCTDGQAAAGACPAASWIGTVDASAGSGSPFVLEQKGTAYLTEGYKGCPYGLLVNVPVIAGPFRGDMQLSDINVRQKICVDRSTAQVTATSDPLPLIHHGVPLRVRSVTVNVDRDRFMLNPSGCEAKQITAGFSSPQAATSTQATPFHTANCANLAFKPKLALRLTGRKQVRTGRHPGIRAQVTQKGIREAGIEKAVVRLPKSLALDVDNAQALCEFADGTKPDLEDHCPKGSIVGRARAVSPLLNDPLVGNVYFVKNVRTDPETGNLIRTLPMIVVALRGEIAVNLVGKSSTTKAGKLVNTFDQVPDAPVSRFNLNIRGGKNGILAVTRTRRAQINLCARPKSHSAEVDIDGHNGRRYDRDVRMRTPCSAKQRKAAKRAAKRQAARRAAARRVV
jgi:hypothetical protein